MLKLLIGCDPELFLRNPNSGQFVSAEGIVPGDKLNPHKVKQGTIQVDGFAAEIGITPARTAEEFADNVETVLDELKKYTSGYEHVLVDHVIFSDNVYLGVSDKGRELGCDPDYSAYTRLANQSPIPNPKSLRTAAGHIHIGWSDGKDYDLTDAGHFADCVAVAKQMDWYLGLPNIMMNPGTVRRSLYGKAGSFRVKPYGCEYRTPDNSWLENRDRMKLMFTNAVLGMEQLYQGNHCSAQYNGVDRAINKADPSFAKLYMQVLKISPYTEEKKSRKAA